MIQSRPLRAPAEPDEVIDSYVRAIQRALADAGAGGADSAEAVLDALVKVVAMALVPLTESEICTFYDACDTVIACHRAEPELATKATR